MKYPNNKNICVQRTRRGLEIDIPTARFAKYSYEVAGLICFIILASVFIAPTIDTLPLHFRYKMYLTALNFPGEVISFVISLLIAENFARNRLFSEKIIISDNKASSKEPGILQQVLHPDRIIYLSQQEAEQAQLRDVGEEKQLVVSNEFGDHSIAEKISDEDRIWIWHQLRNPSKAKLTLIAPEYEVDDPPLLPLLERITQNATPSSHSQSLGSTSSLTVKKLENSEKISYPVGRKKRVLERVYVVAIGLLIFFKTVNSDIPEINRLITTWNRFGFDAVIRRGTELDNAEEAVISLVVGLTILFIFLYFARKQRPEVIEIQKEKILVKTGAQPTGPIIKKGRITKFIFGDFLKPKRKHQLSPEDLRSLSNEENQLSFIRNGKRYNFAVGTNSSDRDQIIQKLKSHSMINL